MIFQLTPAVSTITTTTQAIEDTLALTATTTKGANQQTRTISDTVASFRYYSGFNYHNNNPGNRRYVNSNCSHYIAKGANDQTRTVSDTVGLSG